MSKYKYLIFDLDDTLLDFQAIEKIGLEEVFKSNNIEYNKENISIYKEINRTLWKQLEDGLVTKDEVLYGRFDKFFDAININADGMLAEQEFRSYLNEGHIQIDGAKKIIETLHKQDYIVLAGSNGLDETQYLRLEKAEMLHYFDKLFISESIGYEKPNPKFFHSIFESYPDMNKNNVLMIGDRLNSDIKGANNVGIDSIWFNPDNQDESTIKPTYMITSLNDILKILSNR